MVMVMVGVVTNRHVKGRVGLNKRLGLEKPEVLGLGKPNVLSFQKIKVLSKKNSFSKNKFCKISIAQKHIA